MELPGCAQPGITWSHMQRECAHKQTHTHKQKHTQKRTNANMQILVDTHRNTPLHFVFLPPLARWPGVAKGGFSKPSGLALPDGRWQNFLNTKIIVNRTVQMFQSVRLHRTKHLTLFELRHSLSPFALRQCYLCLSNPSTGS